MAKEKLSAASTQPVDLDNKQLEDLPLDDTENAETPKEAASTATATDESKTTVPVTVSKEEDEENAPPRPRRPESPILKLQREMKEAFPDVDEKTVYAILIASQGQQEPAFNALLYLSDPSYKPEITLVEPAAPPLPGRRGPSGVGSTDDDERLARELQKQFEQEERRRRREYRRAQPQQNTQGQDSEIPDEFEQIKETFAKGVEDARTTINGWVSSFAKKIDGKRSDDEDDYGNNGANSGNSPKLFGALGGSSVTGRSQGRQGGKARFDEDPVILSSGVNLISLHNQEKDDSEAPSLPKRKESPGSVTSPVSNTSAKPSKWQPLSSDVPVNSDAFLVTDSDDELDTKKEKK